MENSVIRRFGAGEYCDRLVLRSILHAVKHAPNCHLVPELETSALDAPAVDPRTVGAVQVHDDDFIRILTQDAVPKRNHL
jgi:hypothetical protein